MSIHNPQLNTVSVLLLLLASLIWSATASGQKFMIENFGDTLPYQEEMEIINGDTIFVSTCWTFERRNGQLINQTDENCLEQGRWVIIDSLGNYSVGNYKDGGAIGVWKYYDKTGRLLREKESITLDDENYVITEVVYEGGVAKSLTNKPFLGFYLKNLKVLFFLIFVSLFLRLFINSEIYNLENKTNMSPIYFNIGPMVSYSKSS